MNKEEETIVISEDEVRITSIKLPWRDVANLMVQILILFMPVSFAVMMIYFMCMAAFGAVASLFN